MSEQTSPAELVRYDTVIRLTCFRPKTTDADQAALCEAWKQMAEKARDSGLVYRELDRQVPEWTRMAAKEVDHPIDATLLEYAVFEPGAELHSFPALPEEFKDAYELTEDLHTIAFRFAKKPERLPSALLFNLFELNGPAGMQQGFLMDWPARGEWKFHEHVTLTTMLHQRIFPDATYKAFNRVEIQGPEAYAENIDRFEAAFPRTERLERDGDAASTPGKPPVVSHLGLFEVEARVYGAEPVARPMMKASVVDDYGAPEVLRWQDVPRPEPGPGQIRVKVRACSINPLDVQMRSGAVRHMYPPWFPDVIGYSIAGVVDAVGRGVTGREIGEEVYGINNPVSRHGYAEYLVGPERFFHPKPSQLNWEAAAAATSVFATAFGGLFLRTNLQAGQTVLIHGGAGVIGSCAIQLARHAGVRVIATASGDNLESARQLGADVVVDYKNQRFEDFAKDVDLVLDSVGGETRERSWTVVRKGGTLASLVPPPPDPHTAEKYGIHAHMVHGHPDIGEILPQMTELLRTGVLAPPRIASTFAMSDAAAAHAAYERKTPSGRMVLVLP